MILAGGRGKGHFTSGLKGGVHLTKDPIEVSKLCTDMIGYNLITKQTPPSGVKVNNVSIIRLFYRSSRFYLKKFECLMIIL